MAKILIVDDDKELAGTLKECLEVQMHAVEVVHDGKEARDRMRLYNYDLVILDLTLPDADGIELLRAYRGARGTTRVLILSGRNSVSAKELGLDVGADDYLVKPFHVNELLARLRALLRRPEAMPQMLTVGDLSLDPLHFKLTRNGTEIPLLPKEYALLEFLMRHPGQYFTSEALLNRIWPSESNTSPDAIRVHMTRLRSKIAAEGQQSPIQTLRGQGYVLQPEP